MKTRPSLTRILLLSSLLLAPAAQAADYTNSGARQVKTSAIEVDKIAIQIKEMVEKFTV